jgi:subtilisin-like proprotein convertase family protein
MFSILSALAAALSVASASAFAAPATFSNPAPISIPDSGMASLYPSQIEVSGVRGPIDQLVLGLNGVSHIRPKDLDVLLVSPSGRKSYVMSDVCGDASIVNRTWAFSRNTPGSFMGDDCPTGVYRDTDADIGAADVWPGAPPGDVGTLFNIASGDANGTWKLYVVDDTNVPIVPDSGSIQGGWSLELDVDEPDILIPAGGTSGPAAPYPATRSVSGLGDVITDVDVTVAPVFHRRPDDLDVLLVGPEGQRVMLMSDACGEPDLDGPLRLADEAVSSIPDADACAGGYRPTDHEPGEDLPAPAPPGPYATSLSAFDLTDPNGDWRLYVSDDSDGEYGWITDFVLGANPSFFLDIETRPKAKVAFGAAAATLTEGGATELSLVRTGAAELGGATVTVTSAPASARSGEDYKPVATTVEFAPGQTRKTISVEALADSVAEGEETLSLTIGERTGDAEPADPSTARVTIRDPAVSADTSAPQTEIVKGPRRKTSRRAARVRFRANEAARFECKLDRQRFKPCRSPGKLERLRPGRHRFAVRAIDRAGNVDPTPAVRRWRVVK